MSGLVVAADNSSVKKATASPGLPPKFRASKNFLLFPYTISAQPDQVHFAQLFEQIHVKCKLLGKPYKIRVIDLREEQHCFADGESVSWLDPDSILNLDLHLHTNKLAHTKIHFLQERKSEDKPVLRDVYTVTSEKDFLTAYDRSIEYRHMPIVNHGIPGAQFIDALIADFHADKELPEVVITHFHCKGGNTRSAFAAALKVLMILCDQHLIDPTKTVEWHLKEYLDEKSLSRLYPLTLPVLLERESSAASIRSNRSSTLSFSSARTDEEGSSMEKILARAEELERFFMYIIDEKYGFSAGRNWTQWHSVEFSYDKPGSANVHPFMF